MWRAVAAAFLLFVFFPSSYAQRGGGHAGGGGMHGFSGGGMHGFAGGGMHSLGGGGVRSFGGGRPAAGFRAPMGVARFSPGSLAGRQFGYRPHFAPVSRPNFGRSQALISRSFPQRRGDFGRTSSFHNGSRNFSSRGDRFFHNHRFHDRFFYAFPFYSYGGYWGDPFYDEYWNPYYSFGPYSYDPNADSSSYTDLSGQLSDMNLQLQQLRDENESLLSELDESRVPAAPTSTPTSPSTAPTTVLVFNDGHQRQVQNYAIVGQTLWILSDARATKVPLADLNLNQTIKTNEDRGVEFLGPASKQ